MTLDNSNHSIAGKTVYPVVTLTLAIIMETIHIKTKKKERTDKEHKTFRNNPDRTLTHI